MSLSQNPLNDSVWVSGPSLPSHQSTRKSTALYKSFLYIFH